MPAPSPSSTQAAAAPVMMLFFSLFISKVLEITVPVGRSTTMAVRRYEASAVPLRVLESMHCNEPDGCTPAYKFSLFSRESGDVNCIGESDQAGLRANFKTAA